MTLTSSLSVHQGIAVLCMAALLSMDLATTVHAQSAPIVYPSAGQSMDQQGRDEAECRNWATQQTRHASSGDHSRNRPEPGASFPKMSAYNGDDQ